MSDVVNEFREIWELADELAQKEAEEYIPPAILPITEEFNGPERPDRLTPAEFRAKQREKHILEMLELHNQMYE